jgi:Na+/H+-dicarboxylate symporter
LGLILGVIAGFYISADILIKFHPIGTVFLNLIKMIIGPLILFSLVSGITSISDPKILGRLGIKSLISFLITTVFAVMFSIVVGNVFRPGEGTMIQLGELPEMQESKFNIGDFLVKIFPDNPIDPFLSGNTLQIVFMATFIGVIINKLEDNDSIKDFFQKSTKLIFRMIAAIIELSPYAAFALISYLVASQGFEVLYSLSKLVGVVTVAMIAQYLIYGVMILIFCRISPMPFYRKSLEYQVLAFSTSSSKATLPTTMEVCRKNLGISEVSTAFVLPLGAAMNMNGLAINLGITAIFFSQVLGMPMSLEDYIILTFTATIGSIGAAGVPGGSIIMLPMVLSSVGLPIEGVAVLAGIDRIMDMMRTTINITGDVAVTMIVDHNEGTFNKKVYDS